MKPTLSVALAAVALARFTHASMVKSCSCRLVGLPTRTASVLPSKTKARPTLPGPKVALPINVPSLASISSQLASSPRHQLIKPEAGGAHGGGGFTVSTAVALLVEPILLEI